MISFGKIKYEIALKNLMENVKKSSNLILIDAHNIHTGGARNLLNFFIQNSNFDKNKIVKIVLDSRYNSTFDFKKFFSVRKVKANIFSRAANVIRICFFEGTLLCFGNLPPLFPRSNYVIVFLHNSLFFEPQIIKKFPIKTRLRLIFESIYFRFTYKRVNKFLVQTEHMKEYLCALSVNPNKILVAPFIDLSNYNKKTSFGNSFICVSSGDAHKNLKNLILAWIRLSSEGLLPKLYLTLSKKQYSDLCRWVDFQIKMYNLNIENVGLIDSSKINSYYRNGSSLIFPSFTESFGLPLVEAYYSGAHILASELDFVRDIVIPNETFDPNSPTSIARAVKRYLGIPEIIPKIRSIEELSNELFGEIH